MSEQTLLEQLGGSDGVRAAVIDLYGRLLDDDLVARYFDDIDLPRLQLHMIDFLVAALTGAKSGYSGRPLDAAHHGLGVTDAAFDSVVAHLGQVLVDAGASDESVAEVVELLSPLRVVVVEHSVNGSA